MHTTFQSHPIHTATTNQSFATFSTRDLITKEPASLTQLNTQNKQKNNPQIYPIYTCVSGEQSDTIQAIAGMPIITDTLGRMFLYSEELFNLGKPMLGFTEAQLGDIKRFNKLTASVGEKPEGIAGIVFSESAASQFEDFIRQTQKTFREQKDIYTGKGRKIYALGKCDTPSNELLNLHAFVKATHPNAKPDSEDLIPYHPSCYEKPSYERAFEINLTNDQPEKEVPSWHIDGRPSFRVSLFVREGDTTEYQPKHLHLNMQAHAVEKANSSQSETKQIAPEEVVIYDEQNKALQPENYSGNCLTRHIPKNAFVYMDCYTPHAAPIGNERKRLILKTVLQQTQW